MSLEHHFDNMMELLLNQYSDQSISIEQLIHSIDLTLLDEHASLEAISKLKKDANQFFVAAVCMYMQHLHLFSHSNSTNLATVINFPLGADTIDSSLTSIEEAADLGAIEIDYVFPYRMYLGGENSAALNQCHAIIECCKQKELTTKIILETGAFPDHKVIYDVSIQLIGLGCDFIKTSTGKIAQGASLSSSFAILSAIKDTKSQCGIKLSGGIKHPQQAFHYAKLAQLMLEKPIHKSWFRIGSSSLLGDLLHKI